MKKKCLCFMLFLLSTICLALGLSACNPNEFLISVEGYTLQIEEDETYSIVGIPSEILQQTHWTVPEKIGEYPISHLGAYRRRGGWFASPYYVNSLGYVRWVTLPSSILSVTLESQHSIRLFETENPLSTMSFEWEHGNNTEYYLAPYEEEVEARYLAPEDFVDNMAFLLDTENNTATLLFGFCEGELVIPQTHRGATVTTLGYQAFVNEKVTSVSLHSQLTAIGENAFANTEITELTFPEIFPNISKRAFAFMKLENVNFSSDLSVIGEEAFSANLQLKSVTIPSTVSEIGARAFSDGELENLTIHEGVSIIEDGAFKCNNLSAVSLPSSIEVLGDGVFSTNPLTSFDFSTTTLMEIPAYTFSDCPLTGELRFPTMVERFEEGCFKGSQLSEFDFPSTLKIIENDAFENVQLANIQLPNGIEKINSGAFANNLALTQLILPDSCGNFDADALYGCENLQKLYLGKAEIEPFNDVLPNLSEIKLSEDNTQHYVQNGILYGIVGKNLIGSEFLPVWGVIKCPAKLDIRAVEINVSAIQSYAFAGNAYIKEVRMSDEVERMAVSAFQGCKGLESVVLSVLIAQIPQSAFEGCENLTQINTENIEIFRGRSFYGCSMLQEVSLERAVEIYAEAFTYCDIREVCSDTCTLVWTAAFEYNENLTKVILKNCQRIGPTAFAHCKNLSIFETGNADLGHNVVYDTPFDDGEGGVLEPGGCRRLPVKWIGPFVF